MSLNEGPLYGFDLAHCPNDRDQKRFSDFNVFKVLRLETYEIYHSNFLGWLLDPSQSHGQGELFLRAFVEVIDKAAPRDQRFIKRRSPRTTLFTDAYVTREFGRHDLHIVFPVKRLVICVEHKVRAGEQKAQLARYAEDLLSYYPNYRRTLIYLTPTGLLPTDERWRALSHRQLICAIANAQEHLCLDTPSEVRTFIRNYLQVVESVCNEPELAKTNRSHFSPTAYRPPVP
jgi:PD-(D/E)XK nuclease superfamily